MMFFRGRSKRIEETKDPDQETSDFPEAVLFDEATGLYKSWYFERRVHEEVQRSARHGRPFAVIFWEPRLLPGEALADEAIARAGAVIKHGLRQTDLPARFDTSRFAALLVESERNTARTMAHRIKTSLGSRVRSGPGRWRTGLAIFPQDGVDVATLFQAATRKLSKDMGMAA